MVLPFNSRISLANNQTVSFDTITVIKDSRTFIPLRFVSETLGEEAYYKNSGNNRSNGEISHISDIRVYKVLNV